MFAGVSLEGSVIIERFDANKKLYGSSVKGRDLLNGTIPPPPEADVLYRALDLKTSSGEMHSSPYRYDQDETSSYSTTDSQPLSFNRAVVHNMAKGNGILRPHGSDYDRQITPPPEINERSLVSSQTHQEELKARALFNFSGEQEGDLAFHKGDVISIIKKSDTQNDWWTGKINNRQGIVSDVFI